MTFRDDVRRANEALDWIEARQGPLKPDGYARIETTVGQVRAMAEGQDDDARLAQIRDWATRALAAASAADMPLAVAGDTVFLLARLDALAAECEELDAATREHHEAALEKERDRSRYWMDQRDKFCDQLADEKKAHALTQGWLDKFQSEAATQQVRAIMAEQALTKAEAERDAQRALAAEAADVARENEALIEEVKAAGEQIAALAAERDELRSVGLRLIEVRDRAVEGAEHAFAERDAAEARAERAEAAIREALYDYDHRDELSAVDRLRAALAAASEGE